MQGAGGTNGGIAKFFMGLAMLSSGGYLFLDAVRVSSGFNWGMSLYRAGGMRLTTGTILIVFVFGIGILFYNAKNILGWGLTCGSLLALIFGILRSLRFRMSSMSLFELLLILVLLFGGIGLFLSSFKDHSLPAMTETE